MAIDYNCIDTCFYDESSTKKANFVTMKEAGVDYAIFRSIRKNLIIDQAFESYYKNAKSAGIKIGVYLYSYATSLDYAKKEANALLDLLDGRSLELPVFYDLESRDQVNKVGKTAINEYALAFKKIVENAGYKFGLYCDADYYKCYIDKSKFSDTPFWIAKYSNPKPTGISNMVAWQYQGTVSGVGMPSGIKIDRSHWYDASYNTGSTTSTTTSSYTTEKYEEVRMIDNCNSLNTRKGPGTSYGINGSYKKGDIVNITEIALEDGKDNGWANTSKGWISYKKYTSDAIGCVTITCNALNLRSSADSSSTSNIKKVARKNESYKVFNTATSNQGSKWYLLENGLYCSSNSDYISYKNL